MTFRKITNQVASGPISDFFLVDTSFFRVLSFDVWRIHFNTLLVRVLIESDYKNFENTNIPK